jgi:hypothetical protein
MKRDAMTLEKANRDMIREFYTRQAERERLIFDCPVASRLTERQCLALQSRPSIKDATNQDLPVYRPSFCDKCPRFTSHDPGTSLENQFPRHLPLEP